MKRSILFIFVVLLVPAMPCLVKAQDRPTTSQPALPFQQNAPTAGNDEQLAMQFFQARDFEKAAQLYEELYEKRPGQFYYTYLLYSYIELRDFDKAEKLIRAQRKLEPGRLKYTVDLGYVAFRTGEAEKAEKLYDEALKRTPPEQSQINELANAFILRGENEYAVKVYKKGRELLNHSYPFSFELASLYERTGDIRGTIGEYLYLVDLNPSYLKTVEDRLQNILAADPENLRNEEVRKALLEKVQKEPDNPAFSELMWWYSLQEKDFEMALIQGKSLDRRLKEDGQRLISLAQIAVSNQQYDVAEQALRYVLAKGKENLYQDFVRIELLNTRYQEAVNGALPVQEELTGLAGEIRTELGNTGENGQTLGLMISLAHLDAFYLNNPDAAIETLERAISLNDLKPQPRAQCKLELADILLYYGDVWAATLLYQQVYKDFKYDVIGQTAKFKNAKLSFYIGEFKWAKAQADILKAATTKLISNDAIALSLLIGENLDPDSGTVALTTYARADLLEYKNKPLEALQTLDSIPMLFIDHPIMDEVFFRKAMIYQKLGEYGKTDSLLGIVISNYGDGILADSALMKRGYLRELLLKDQDGAMACYQEILDKYPGSVYAVDARKRFRILRGDKPN